MQRIKNDTLRENIDANEVTALFAPFCRLLEHKSLFFSSHVFRIKLFQLV